MAIDAVQKIIHRLEVGGGPRLWRIVLSVLVLLSVVLVYNIRGYRNLATEEAMDLAQLARNIAQGKGYTTLFVRPLSMYLVSKQNQEPSTEAAPPGANVAAPEATPLNTGEADASQIKGMHPDLANPPVYPVILAVLMKVADKLDILPLDYTIPSRPHPFWGRDGHFWWHPPDFFIAVFNELLFLAVVALQFLLARRLFDKSTAWLASLLLLGTELYWRFSVSGLSTMLLLVIFMGLVWTLALLEQETREPRWGLIGFFAFAILAGLLVGVGSLTRYAFAWLILPVMLFIIMLAERRQRILVGVITFLAFASILTPWVVRNYMVSGTPFGTASFTVKETTGLYPEHKLQRSLDPDLSRSPSLMGYRQKLVANLRQIIGNDLPKLSGSWVSAFFLAGLLIGVPNPTAGRLRHFVLACLVVLIFVQALGHTQLSEDSPEVNSENLLVLLGPLVLIYGVSFFYLLLDQIDFPFRELRYAAVCLCGVLVCLPLLLTFLQTRGSPIPYPPYYPPQIQAATDWTKEDELMMSDIPWAVAWYGQRQCVWLGLNRRDFFNINDFRKPVQTLLITHVSSTEGIMSMPQWFQGAGEDWGLLTLECFVNKLKGSPDTSTGFPLKFLQGSWRPDAQPMYLILTYRQTPVNAETRLGAH